MTCHDDLRNGGHTHQVGADFAEEPDLGRGLIGRTGAAEIDATVQIEPELYADLFGKVLKLKVVGAGHVRETGTEFSKIGADERIGHHVDVVLDDDQVADMILYVGSACGVRDEQELDAEEFHDPYAEGNQLHGIAFVEMQASLHGYDLLATEGAINEIALVANCC